MIFHDLNGNAELLDKLVLNETRCLALLDGCYRTGLVSGSFYRYQGHDHPWFVSDDGGEFSMPSIRGVALLSFDNEAAGEISISELTPESIK